jgi:glycosyltransferase involved in cell wall biosynthesis
MQPSRPAISVVMLVGTNRANAQGVLDALGRQSCADDLLEIVVFDCADESVPALQIPGRFSGKYLRRPGLYFWRVARALAAKESTAPIVAFLEDHCEPHATWAERLLEAYSDGRWAAVGYAFTNGSRDSWWSRSALMADYGFFVHPAEGGPARLLAGNNVSYARWFLAELGEHFGKFAGVDFNVQQMANVRGLPMKVAPDVLVVHRCYASLGELCAVNFYYLKILSVARARANGWSFPIRLVWACGVVTLVPALRLLRLAKSISRRPELLSTFLASMPVMLLVYYAAAFGEATGYLLGLGDAEEKFLKWELNTPRIA